MTWRVGPGASALLAILIGIVLSINAPASVLRVQQPFTGTPPDTFALTNPISSIIFNREGFAQSDLNNAFAADEFTLHDSTANPAWTRCLLISAQGMIQTETAQNPTLGPCN